jgi:hypothetical protein
MRSSVATPAQSDPVRSLDNIRPTTAKAVLKSDPVGLSFVDVMTRAVVKHYGSVKAAAISLRVDPSLMMREFEAGKFGRLEAADADAKAFISDTLHQAYGPSDPRARAQRLINQTRAMLDELAEVI